MSTINLGHFKGHRYIKLVSFSKAVLWKDRQISLRASVCKQFKERGVTEVVFEDHKKNERWIASVDTLRDVKIYKKEGQEAQFYFPISAFKKEPIHEEKVGEKGKEVPPPKDGGQQSLDIHSFTR